MKTVLASSSPRRKELLETAGIDFETDVEGVEEIPQGNTPEEKVCSGEAAVIWRRKASSSLPG